VLRAGRRTRWRPADIAVRERDEKVGERVVLAAEKQGEILGECACGVHAATLARDLEAS
jgi:hypothetical protein